jgi:hypothetical protein
MNVIYVELAIPPALPAFAIRIRSRSEAPELQECGWRPERHAAKCVALDQGPGKASRGGAFRQRQQGVKPTEAGRGCSDSVQASFIKMEDSLKSIS